MLPPGSARRGTGAPARSPLGFTYPENEAHTRLTAPVAECRSQKDRWAGHPHLEGSNPSLSVRRQEAAPVA